MKKSQWVQIIIFLVFIYSLLALSIYSPDKDFSERENRYLMQLPGFSLETLFSGKYISNLETYSTDQFFMRDGWTTLKAIVELGSGKSENKGVYYCQDETLIEGYESPDQNLLDTNISALNALCANTDIPVYFALIPGAPEIWSYKLPPNAPNASQLETIIHAYSGSDASNIDMYNPLLAHQDEYIFYRTDHHWTSLGAYYGYTAIMDAFGMAYPAAGEYSIRTVSQEFYGTIYSSSGFSWVRPDSIEVFVDPDAGVEVTNYPAGSPVTGKIYDESFLAKKDKYSMFMGGNSPLQYIRTGAPESAPSILIIRDSYMDSEVPFLLDDFSEIYLMDLRYYRQSLKNFLLENPVDIILVCYSVTNFSIDQSIYRLGE